MLSNQDKNNLKKINKILSESYGFEKEISSKLSKSALVGLKQKAQENMSKIVESSEFNTYHKNKDYNQCMLVVEAANILLNKKPTQSDLDEITQRAYNESQIVSVADKYNDLRNMYESYVEKNGENEKSEKMKARLGEIEKQMYSEDISKKLNILLKEDADKAEAIMSAKGLLDDILGYQHKIGETQNRYLDPFIEMVRSEYTNEMADDIYNRLNDSLTELLTHVRATKEVFANVVGVLSGEGELEDSMVEPEAGESMDSDEADDLDLGSLEDAGEEAGAAEEGDVEIDLNDLGSDEEAEETEFKRKKED